uniref:Uncharacterized protein n=1 Tax=Candidatus Kentrum sp. UNK TaxID=2126344 RepID=A0A451A0F7_9GAMM|nr:MAG: hypothetical protein BECKUNK1418G_GA0071005_100738 [Candidatus Kentron sp. UNK]VFK68700.1 MAG: hypothetical protein BECKUNK1418H_GA0071006_100514 [Candidatus Kentron sp. UNK]
MIEKELHTENNKTVYGLETKIVFFILFITLLFPSGYFIKKSYDQLEEILEDINEFTHLRTTLLLEQKSPLVSENFYFVKSKISLEHDLMRYRHQRITASLATRTWMRFMSLMFGAILTMIGSGFVLGRITSPAFIGKLSFRELGTSVATSSPGLLLVVMGVILIVIPNLSTQRIVSVDSSPYIGKGLCSIESAEKQQNDDINGIMEEFFGERKE